MLLKFAYVEDRLRAHVRFWRLAAILMFGLFLAALLSAPACAQNMISSENVRVRDGDTIVVGTVPVRLQGVDAPEMGAPYGAHARDIMRQIVSGHTVFCLLTGNRTYDRHVGVCYITIQGDQYDVGATLIASGAALDCRRYSNGRYRDLETREARRLLSRARYC